VSPNVHQVAIIGAGQLGRRHLQGLVKSSQALSIHVVDPSEASRRAVEEYIAAPESGALPPIQVHASLDALPPELALVVVATTANQRLEVIEQLARVSRVQHLILEKFLFNDSAHYAQAEATIAAHRMRAWVNTPRRHFSVYRELRERMKDERLLQFTADGGDWGLCCNSVHFVDLVQFLTGESELRQLSTRIDDGLLPSKRDGYVELTGEVQGQVGSARFTVRSIRGSTKPITLTLHYESQTVFVSEAAGTSWLVGQGPVQAVSFRLPYQSEMTGTIADQLLLTGTCDLTPYAESSQAHLPLLHAFARLAGEVTGSNAKCAIT
jgi:predicted dehydrogenase